VLLAMTHAVQSAVQAVELMYRMAGTSGVSRRNPLERYFPDVQVLRHHAFGTRPRTIRDTVAPAIATIR